MSYKESLDHLPYFDAVLKEAMRVHPSIGLLMERHVPPEGATICGVDLPGGKWIISVPQHDPKIMLALRCRC